MNNPKAKLAKLLDSKLNLFEKMEIFLLEQKHHLEEKKYAAFREKSDDIDIIIANIKNIDYDIARCESNDDEIADLINSGKDDEIRAKLHEAMRIAERNHDLMDELAGKLRYLQDELKEALGDNIEMSKISGYKAITQPSPVYFDKTS